MDLLIPCTPLLRTPGRGDLVGRLPFAGQNAFSRFSAISLFFFDCNFTCLRARFRTEICPFETLQIAENHFQKFHLETSHVFYCFLMSFCWNWLKMGSPASGNALKRFVNAWGSPAAKYQPKWSHGDPFQLSFDNLLENKKLVWFSWGW